MKIICLNESSCNAQGYREKIMDKNNHIPIICLDTIFNMRKERIIIWWFPSKVPSRAQHNLIFNLFKTLWVIGAC